MTGMMTHEFERADWMVDAECRGMDVNTFFPSQGEATAHIRAICAECPVKQTCADMALADSSLHGFWGGLSEKERRQWRRRERPRRLRLVEIGGGAARTRDTHGTAATERSHA